MKLFADDTSLFTIVHNPDQAASDMNHDLDVIKSWARNWRMLFNPDPTKQAVEVTFSRKKISANHPPVLFNDIPVIKMNEHKHLGIILDSKLSFATHIQSIILKCRRGIGMIKFLSKYLPRNTLTELYKLYVRPHLDYGVIYHIPPKKCDFSEDTSLNNHMEKLESVQYSAALAVTGAWTVAKLGREGRSCSVPKAQSGSSLRRRGKERGGPGAEPLEKFFWATPIFLSGNAHFRRKAWERPIAVAR